MRYKVLVLTDHSNHSDQNSIYAILTKMMDHPQCESIHVASRGVDLNRGFFDAHQRQGLFCQRIDKSFRWTEDGASYSQELQKFHVDHFDLVFLRLPRPISDEFLLWIEDVFAKAIIINRPSGILRTSNKKYLLNFPQLCPNIRHIVGAKELKAYAALYPIVLKPLHGYGGQGIVKIKDGIVEDSDREIPIDDYILEVREILDSVGYLGMKFLNNVRQGDKRILVVGGKIMASSLRMPAADSWLCNVAQGGTSIGSEVSTAEVEIVNTIAPSMRANGVLIYGVDTLMGDDGERVLSEINTLSIGGFPQAQEQSGLPVISDTIDELFKYADGQ